MYSKSVLSPPSGSYFLCNFTTLRKSGGDYIPEYTFQIVELQFSKDITGPTGDGTLTTPYLQGQENLIREGQLILIKGVWDLNSNSKVLTDKSKDNATCICYGAIKKVKLQRKTMDIEFTDMGILLEAAGTGFKEGAMLMRKTAVERIIKGSGLIGVLDWGSNANEMMAMWDMQGASSTGTSLVTNTKSYSVNEWQARNDYNKNYSTGNPPADAPVISHSGWYPVNQCAGKIPWKSFPFAWLNYCPACGSVGTLKIEGKPTYGGIYCSKCDVDYDPVGGFGTSVYIGGREVGNAPTGSGVAACRLRLTPHRGGTSGDVSAGYSSIGSTTWWDLLTELLNPINVDLMAYVKGKKLYIKEPPAPSTVKLWVDDQVNLVKDSVTVTEADPTTPNTVIVNYGKSAAGNSVRVQNKKMVTQYGTITQKYDKPDLNAVQAKAYGEKMLNKLERNNGFSIDCTVIYHPYYFVGEWCRFKHRTLDIDDVYMITKTNMKLTAKSTPKVDLTLTDYVPFVSSSGSGGSQGIFAQMDIIGEKEAQFEDVQGNCHNAQCIEQTGKGDCWADSEWLYLQLNRAGINARIVGYATRNVKYPRHCWVQINVGNGWVDWDYKKYNSEHYGNVSPGAATRVLISEGKTSAAQVDIGSTGY